MVLSSLSFAQAVIMVDCGQAEHRAGLWIHPDTWHQNHVEDSPHQIVIVFVLDHLR